MHILLRSDASDAVAGVLMPASFYQLNLATVKKWWSLSDPHHKGVSRRLAEFLEKINDFVMTANNVHVLHQERIGTLTKTIISRLYSLVRFTVTNLLRPTLHRPPLVT